VRLLCGSAGPLLVMILGVCALGAGERQSENLPPASTRQDSPESHLGSGYMDLKSDRYDDAVREFRAALELDPSLGERARFPLAVALFELQKTAEARKEFDTVRARTGDRPDVMYYLGRLDLMEGNPDAAIKDLTLAAARPPFPDTAYYLGSAYLKKGRLPEAEKWLRAAAGADPQDAHVQERLGVLYLHEGRKQDAEKAAARAAELREREAEVSRERIDCAQALGSSEPAQKPIGDQAREVCERLYDPDDAAKLTILGTLYGQHADYAAALKPLRRAAELDPRSPQMQYNLALDYFQLGRYPEARDALLKVIALWPDLYPLHALLGATLYKLGDEAPAYQALHHAHDLNPADSETAEMLFQNCLALAETNLQSKHYQDSVRYLAEAASLAPEEPEPHRLLAEIYRATGRQSQAAEEQRQFEILLAKAPKK
jgi:tetratricopeptide (TPR) repeat protein